MITYLQAVASVLTGVFDHKSERGATAVEYGIMVAAIAVAIIIVVFALGGQISTLFGNVSSQISAKV